MIATGKAALAFEIGDHRAQAPLDPIADHRWPHAPWDSEGNCRTPGGIGAEYSSQRSATGADADRLELGEPSLTREPARHAERRARPFWRRDRNTARPPRLLIRCRNPCFLDRFLTLG